MNKIHKIICLIGMMVLPIGLAIAGPADGWTDQMIFEALIFWSVMIFMVIPYIGMRLICWIYGIVLFIFKQKWDKWNVLLLIADIPVVWFAFYVFNIVYIQPKKQEEILRLNRITLSQQQEIAGILMPAGTELETDLYERRTQPEPQKFRHAKFPQTITWNGIPTIKMSRIMGVNHYKNNTLFLHEIITRSTQTVVIGQFLCDKNFSLGWKLQQKNVPIPYYHSVEPYAYLSACTLQQGQNISIPTFHDTLTLSLDKMSIERKQDEFRDVEQGLWYINIPKNEHTKSAMKIDFNKFYLMVNSQKTVHNFLIELNDSPEKHCGLPKNTLLGWRKSQPKTILVATYPTQNVPQTCWGKKLQKVSVDEMRDALPQQDRLVFEYSKITL